MTNESLLRNLGLREAIAIVIGTIIGTGVFLKTAVMAQQAGSPAWVLAAWAAAGTLSFAGALSYAELGARFPRAGGEYIYLKEAYGPLMAFLYGWMRFWIGSPGSIAAYGVGAAIFLNNLLPGLGMVWPALALIIFFTIVNCFSVAFGGKVQTFMTALKIFMVLGLAAAILLFGANTSWTHLAAPLGNDLATPLGGGFAGFPAFGAAMLAALWAFDGWNNMPMAAGEIRDPEKVIPKALFWGLFSVLFIYALANIAYFYALPFSEVLTSRSSLHPTEMPVATKAALSSFGPVTVGILSLAFIFSALGAMNGSILTSARVPFAMARDGLFFSKLGEVSHKSRVPVLALLVQGAWSCVLALSGSFDQLTDYVVFASWIFYALCTAALFKFRRLDKTAPSYRTPGFPLVPIIFILVSLLLLANTLYTAPKESGIGLAFILVGIPAYFFFRASLTRKKI